MSYLLHFYLDTESFYLCGRNVYSDSLVTSHWREGGRENWKWCTSRPLAFFFFFSPHKWCFSKCLASLLYGCVTLLDDNRIRWECGPLLYPPYVTTWSDGNGWAAWGVGSALADYFPQAMKTAQVLQRMWVQAVKKLGRLKDHVSPSLQARWAFFFPNLSGREWGAKFVPLLSPCVYLCFWQLSVTNCEMQIVISGGFFKYLS